MRSSNSRWGRDYSSRFISEVSKQLWIPPPSRAELKNFGSEQPRIRPSPSNRLEVIWDFDTIFLQLGQVCAPHNLSHTTHVATNGNEISRRCDPWYWSWWQQLSSRSLTRTIQRWQTRATVPKRVLDSGVDSVRVSCRLTTAFTRKGFHLISWAQLNNREEFIVRK